MPLGTPALTFRRRQLEDVLEHLPASSPIEYGKHQVIYGPARLSSNIYLVLAGTVGISQITEDGTEVLLDILRPDDLFGESAFLDVARRTEQAKSFETVRLMTWAASDIEYFVMKRPRLAVALLQLLAQRNAELAHRIRSLSVDTIERRLARSLIRLSERLGTSEEGGSVHMMPLTHTVLSQYVGTSREVVTQHMNQLRRKGHLSYSRRGIRLHSTLHTLVEQRPAGLDGDYQGIRALMSDSARDSGSVD